MKDLIAGQAVHFGKGFGSQQIKDRCGQVSLPSSRGQGCSRAIGFSKEAALFGMGLKLKQRYDFVNGHLIQSVYDSGYPNAEPAREPHYLVKLPRLRRHLNVMATTTTTNTECARIASQLRSVFEREAWHGPSLRELLSDITSERAKARPLAAAHSIWELVLHIEVWTRYAREAMHGRPIPAFVENMPPEQNWPLINDSTAAGWKAATDKALRAGSDLASEIESFGDERLRETVPGRSYDFERLLRGSVQHCVYHSGQVAILKKALQTPS